MIKALSFVHQADGVARKASDVSAADWRYQTRVRNYRNFTRAQLWLFSMMEILKNNNNNCYNNNNSYNNNNNSNSN